MNKKMSCLVKHSLKKKIKTKWFVVVNILIAILIISLANIDRIISLFGGDFENTTNILVVDNVGVFDNFKKYFEQNSKLIEDVGNYDIKLSKEKVKKLETDIEKDDIILNIEASTDNYLQAQIISFDSISLMDSQLISTSLNNIKDDYVLEKSGLTESQIASLTSSVKIEKKVTSPDKDTYKDSEYKDLLSTGIITLFIVPFFIFITTLVQMLGAEINDEKLVEEWK